MSNALYDQARSLLDQKQFSEALRIYEDFANRGDMQCQVFSGWMTYEGLGTPKNVERAFIWFQKAADKGSSEGAFYCGKMLVTQGRYAEADSWFSNAARTNFGPAVLWMGLLRTRGLIADSDFAAGLSYLREAVRLGNLPAQRELVQLMLTGRFGITGILRGIALFPTILVRGFMEARRTGPSPNLQS